MDKNHFMYQLVNTFVFCLLCFMVIGNAHSSEAIFYGSVMEGGKIACLQSDGGIDNLIAAKEDISSGITWGGQGQAIGPSAQSDTDGLANTKAIIATLGKDTKYAALLCSEYEIDANENTPCVVGADCYRDWFLPARKQLDCVHDHQKEIGGFANDFYWTSTEFAGYPAYTSWDKFFGEGDHPFASEDDLNKVRCVRLFTPK